MTPPSLPDQSAWQPWHPVDLMRRLTAVGRTWCVAGGWALDLWHGRQTSDHEDLEFTILRADLSLFRQALGALAHYSARDGEVTLLPPGAVPVPAVTQIWCHDPAAACWRVDMMLEDGTPDLWVYKRAPALTRPRREMVWRTADGIPYLNPAAVLLFKAKYRRPKDEQDFAMAAGKLEAAERAWLRSCLERLHPGHGWIGRLSRCAGE